jgi:O-succinylbenzoic acid--CoA ligase
MVIFGGKAFTREAIKAGESSGLKPAFRNAFEFCRQWMNGAHSFSIRTSGSTGTPKEISLTREQVLASVRATRRFFEIGKHSHLLCCLDTEKIAGKMMLLRALEWEGSVRVELPTANPLENSARESFDFVAMVPLQVAACFEHPQTREALDRIGILIIGGAAVGPGLRQRIQELPGKVYQTYGMTETVSHVALANLKSSGPVEYRALPEVRLAVDGTNRLCIQSPMSGDDWLVTNDVVEMTSSCTFLWKGRSDFVVNSGGVKLHPEEISQQIAPLVQELFPSSNFFLTGIPDAGLGEALVLILEAETDALRGEELLEAAKALLPKYWNPKAIRFVPRFCWTSTGKIDQFRTLASWEDE